METSNVVLHIAVAYLNWIDHKFRAQSESQSAQLTNNIIAMLRQRQSRPGRLRWLKLNWTTPNKNLLLDKSQMIAQFSFSFSWFAFIIRSAQSTLTGQKIFRFMTNETAEKRQENSTTGSKFVDFSCHSFEICLQFYSSTAFAWPHHRWRITTQARAQFVDSKFECWDDERMFLSDENYARSRWHRFSESLNVSNNS